jgi:predicted DNA-binding transcriptional regulator YafY
MSYFLRNVNIVRADRLLAIVLLLQAHGQLTAADLAERLETSERTIRRDLEALSGAGVPVYAQRGRGGGWALLGGHRLNLSGLTTEEAEALFLVAGPGALAGLGVDPGVTSALRKLLAALPEPLRRQAVAARRAVLVQPPGWGRRHPPDPPHLDVLRRAVVDGRQVDLHYAKPGSEPAWRRVHPYGLVAKGGTWYLVAGSSAGLRTFRVSRVAGVSRRDEAVERPEDFDLAEAWADVESGFAGRMAAVVVELEVVPEALDLVRAVLGRWLTTEEAGQHRGRPLLTVAFPHPEAAARELAPFGRRVAVRSPEVVRQALARLGAELVAANRPGMGRPGPG